MQRLSKDSVEQHLYLYCHISCHNHIDFPQLCLIGNQQSSGGDRTKGPSYFQLLLDSDMGYEELALKHALVSVVSFCLFCPAHTMINMDITVNISQKYLNQFKRSVTQCGLKAVERDQMGSWKPYQYSQWRFHPSSLARSAEEFKLLVQKEKNVAF